ncbi:MAG TPA: hydrogenase expression/formation protein HypE [Lentisphaeria bacterium]|nr:MAG: hydrogenase expression/formation protein HypE [Lentisphaerae bacterium GWF2_49_21]HBC86223.1 hydrogenase expression/formation protein HypE [Lentisphaeria bacterium]
MGDRIQIAHGGGGRLSAELVRDEILSRFGKGPLSDLPDAATLDFKKTTGLVMSTDSFVIQPVEFPGGNIGNLCVYGTVNDISVAGGKPLWLSLGMILEEGLEISLLRKILDSVRKSADECGIGIVTGDTKVVPRGQCDKIYINTTGIGERCKDFSLGRSRIKKGDKVIVSGNIGDHGMAVLCVRESIGIKKGPRSDLGTVQRLAVSAQRFGADVKFMRDPTRGGLAAVLNEIFSVMRYGVILEEKSIPFSRESKAVSEMLGLDLLNSPCEGRVVMICSESAADKIVRSWKKLPEGRNASVIGTVTGNSGKVILSTLGGGARIVDLPRGEMLPRIC